MKQIGWMVIIFLLFIHLDSFSATANFFQDDSLREFEKGKRVNVELDKNGHLFLSSKIKELFVKEDILFIWDIIEDKSDNLYIGTGKKAQVYKLSKDGQPQLLYNSESGNSIISLAVDSKNNIYAAVIPGSKIIKIQPDGTTSVFAEFKEKYIWKIKVDDQDNLYVSTGHTASVYQVSSDGDKKVLYQSEDENHFLCMDLDNKGNVYFASEGKGMVYKWNKATQSTKVLYDTYEDEVKDLVVDGPGNVYFATATNTKKYPPKTFNYKDTFVIYGSYVKKPKKTILKKKAPLKNSVYQVTPSGEVKKLFTKSKTIFLSLALDKQNNLYAGTSQNGLIYKITGVNKVSFFSDTQEQQIISLYVDRDSNLFATTGTVGKVLHMNLSGSNEGTYYSRILNANGNALWGNISWEASQFDNSSIMIHTRTGNSANPDMNWSDWSKGYDNKDGNLISSPVGQYIQYKVVFQSNSYENKPSLKWIKLSYLLDNRAPQIDNIKLKVEISKKAITTIGPYSKDLPPSVYTLTWEAFDRDKDYLIYTIYYRYAEDEQWLLIGKEVTKKRFSFDTQKLPDGNCYFKIVASDESSNGKARAKLGIGISKLFKLDNTPPNISDIQIKSEGNKFIITGKVTDHTSFIKVLEYSLNGQDWFYLGPKDNIYDSNTEEFELIIDPEVEKNLVQGKNFVVFRIADEFFNYSTKEIFFIVE